MAGHTLSESIMLACTENWLPCWWPAISTHFLPVWVATRPWLSRMATWRTSRPSSLLSSSSSACWAVLPLFSRARPRRPNDLLVNDWVATTPTPASPQLTEVPTENQWLCTATAISPVAGSRATMLKVWANGSVAE